MKLRFLSYLPLALACAVGARAQAVPEQPVIITFAPPKVLSVVTLGTVPTTTAFAPGLPVALSVGTHVQLVLPIDGTARPAVTWYKDGKPLSETSDTLDVPSVMRGDSGTYSAEARVGDSPGIVFAGSVSLMITDSTPRLQNVSVRGHIDSSQPALIGGFVVQPSVSYTLLLIRAVGPALAQFGVTDALPTPTLTVFDASGHEVHPPITNAALNLTVDVSLAARAVGAFPLPSGSSDIQRLYLLPAGVYTAHVSSADGSAGTALLEVYQVPAQP